MIQDYMMHLGYNNMDIRENPYNNYFYPAFCEIKQNLKDETFV